MFEAIERGHKISRQDFDAAEEALRAQLLEAQRALGERQVPVIILVSGVEKAGASELTNRLIGWLDPRGVAVETFWEEDEGDHERPAHWQFWRRLPRRGQLSVFFGGWYSRPIVARVRGKIGAGAFQLEMSRVNDLERLLSADGAIIVKLWLHIPKHEQVRRLKKRAQRPGASHGRKPTPWEKHSTKRYDAFVQVCEAAIRATDASVSPWHLIDATHKRYRDLAAGRSLLGALRGHLDRAESTSEPLTGGKPGPAAAALAAEVDSPVSPAVPVVLDEEAHGQRLSELQERLGIATWEAWRRGISSVVLFEGWEGISAEGAIEGLVAPIDARLFQVLAIGPPCDEDRAYHYLRRFWRHVPRDGYLRVFDRSWYRRVLDERVAGLVPAGRWRRAYGEINHFEEQLAHHGVVITKLWLRLPDAQRRELLAAGRATPWTRDEPADLGWGEPARWEAHREAVSEMIARTSTRFAPWVVVEGGDPRQARLAALETFASQLEAAIAAAPKGKRR